MYRGDWKGTVVPIRVCVRSGCVVFNRYVGEVRDVKICDIPTPMRSLWYEFLPGCNWDRCCGSSLSWTQWGDVPVFQDVMGDDRLIRAYPRTQADIGQTIQIFGIDNYNQALTTNNGDGTWSDGVTITLAYPYGSTNVFVRRIDRVIKEVTQGPVNLYGYDSVNNKLEDLAQYAPNETVPSYARYQLGGCGTCTKSVLALVKLRFIPAEVDTDLVLLDNLAALKMIGQADKFREAGNISTARACMVDAVEVLNRQLEDSFPNEQIPISISGIERSCVGVQRMF